MSLRSSISAAAFAAGVLAAGHALANQNYVVIPGIGPETAPRSVQTRGHLGHPSLNGGPVSAYNTPPAPTRVAAGGNYGGGFIELLATGRAPGPAVVNRPPAVDGSRFRSPDRGVVDAPQVSPLAAPLAAPQRHAAIAPDAGFPSRRIDPRFERQEVAYAGRHAPGTIIVDTPSRYLFLVMPNGRAMRYGIGVGRPGFEWAGVKRVTRKAEWPDWRPPSEMLKRRPDLPTFMKGGPENPLGARALYLGSSLYRIHGTNEPWTIGQNVSSGCIRMMNDDVMDLYQRVRVGTRVVVI